MKLPASQALHAHWSALCHGRCAPERKDLDPQAMRHMLDHTFLLDIEAVSAAQPRMPVQVSGSRLDALMDCDLRGSCFLDLWTSDARESVRRIIRDVADETRPAVIGGQAGPENAAWLGFELVLLPLRHKGRTHARILGGVAMSVTPAWLGLRASRPLELVSWRMLDVPHTRRGTTEGDMARHAHLTVVAGGRSGAVPAPKAYVKPVLSRSVGHR